MANMYQKLLAAVQDILGDSLQISIAEDGKDGLNVRRLFT